MTRRQDTMVGSRAGTYVAEEFVPLLLSAEVTGAGGEDLTGESAENKSCQSKDSRKSAGIDLRLAVELVEPILRDEPLIGVEALLEPAVLVAFEERGTEAGCTTAAGAGAAGAGAKVEVVEEEPAAAADVPSFRHD